MEMHQVRYVLALGEVLNFTEAASRCNVSQPSLTRAVQLLETEFGGQLFHRERGNIQLSELGRMVMPHLRELSAHADAATERARELRRANATRLRLGVMCTIAPQPLLSLVVALRKDHPDVDLEIVDAPAAYLEQRLLDGDLDVGLYCRPGRHNDRMHYLKVFSERMVVVLNPTDPLAKRPTLRLEDLNGQRYLNRINCEFDGADIPGSSRAAWHVVCRSDRDDWILAMIAAGMGFGFLPENCATHPGVVDRPLSEPGIFRQVDLVTVRGRPYSSAVGAVVREAMRNGWSPAAD